MLSRFRTLSCALICGLLLLVGCAQPRQLILTPTPEVTVPTPTATNTLLVPTATGTLPVPTSTPISPAVISDIDGVLTDLARQDLFTGSVLIGQRDKVLLSQGYGMADRVQKIPNTAKTRFRLGSITKQFTAMAILILESQGKLSIKDSICRHFADCPAAWETITLEHLLTHTSGITNFTALADYPSTRATPSSPEQTIARFKGLPLDFQPGEKFSYSNSGYVVLGYIIEQVSGQSYEDFLQQEIFTPLNLHDTGYQHNLESMAVGYEARYSDHPADYIDISIPYAAGGLFSTVEDLYRWEQSLSTEELVPRTYLDEMFVRRVDVPDSGGLSYGYGWMIGTDHGLPVTTHAGGIEGFVTVITRYPNEQLTIIMLCNQQYTDLRTIQSIVINKILGGE